MAENNVILHGELEADIAHHWQQLTPTHWRFFLRPGIHFIIIS